MTPATIDSLKRLGAFLITLALEAFDKKLGLNLDPTAKTAIAGLAAGYLAQSMFHSVQKLQSASDAGKTAGGQVVTVDDAVNVLAGGAKILLAIMLIGALTLPSVAHADELPADAPVKLQTGQPAPVSGVLLSDSLAIAEAKRVTACEAERDDLKVSVMAPSGPAWWVYPLIAVIGAGLGAGGVLYLTRK